MWPFGRPQIGLTMLEWLREDVGKCITRAHWEAAKDLKSTLEKIQALPEYKAPPSRRFTV